MPNHRGSALGMSSGVVLKLMKPALKLMKPALKLMKPALKL